MNIKDKLSQCRKDGKALLAANFYNFETMKAVLLAAKMTNSEVILQASESTLKYLGVLTAAAMAKAGLDEYGVRGWLHFDHGATVELVQQCLDAGFDSVMIDASEASFEENVRTTTAVVRMAEGYGANVEAELGYIAKLGQSQEVSCTSPDQARRFVEATGVHALAVAIGNAHGFYKSRPKLHFDVLEAIAAATPVPLVLHGSSGIPDDDLRRAIGCGICKINLATEIKNVFMKKLQLLLRGNEEIDLRLVFPSATDAAKDLLINKLMAINDTHSWPSLQTA
jgi:fructose-bisphosphate aldolase class II/tagatose 1,6-diphosphate aldolase GatY/KbaY